MRAPDELYWDYYVAAPPGGDPVVVFEVCYSGPHRQADRVFEPLRAAGKPLADDVKAVDYVALQQSGDESGDPRNGSYLKGGFTEEISPGLITALVDNFESHPSRFSFAAFQHCGGAITRVAADATAYPHRYAEHDLFITVGWPEDQDGIPHMDWARQYWKTMEPFTYGFYTNEADDENAPLMRTNYQGNYERLVKIKNKYDPKNLFRLNANVEPTV